MSRSADSRPAASLPEALGGLLRPDAYPHPVGQVTLLTTHMSWVLLAGEFAYKIKRPVRFPFADFTSAAHRAELCAEEIRLNRRFAPSLYLDVVQVHSERGQARIGGTGPVIETAVRMRQFDRRDELDVRVAAGTVGACEFAAFGSALATIHATLPPLQAPRHAASLARILRRNYAELCRLVSATGAPGAVSSSSTGAPSAWAALRHALARALRTARPALASRVAAGAIRECHGDLHLSNLVLLDGRITAFDALEFEPAFRRIDVADEVAFLCADLAGRGKPALAQAFLGAYLEASGDYRLLEVLDLYVAHRALVRAKIIAIRAASAAGTDTPTPTGAAPGAPSDPSFAAHRDAYLRVAVQALRPAHERPRPHLLLLHGLSGSGKTWLARQLAPRIEALHLRSDIERKRLAGLGPLDSSGSAPGVGLYAADISARTYSALAAIAAIVLGSGRNLVCDAAFLSRASRDALRAAARASGAVVTLLHCTAPPEELHRRLRARRAGGGDPSEADEVVLDWQLRHVEPLQADERSRLVDIDTTRPDAVDAALRAVAAAAVAGAARDRDECRSAPQAGPGSEDSSP